MGAFDIAIYPVMKAWGFTDDNFRVPDADELKDLLTLTDASDISYDKDTSQIAFKKDGMQIDFGGIAKGYTSARIMDIFVPAGSRADWSILVEMCRHLEQRRMEAAGAWQ